MCLGTSLFKDNNTGGPTHLSPPKSTCVLNAMCTSATTTPSQSPPQLLLPLRAAISSGRWRHDFVPTKTSGDPVRRPVEALGDDESHGDTERTAKKSERSRMTKKAESRRCGGVNYSGKKFTRVLRHSSPARDVTPAR